MKLFVTDLDGTLVEGNELKEENLRAIRNLKDNNGILAVATGRPYNGCSFLKDKYDIQVDYFVLLNGGLIIDKDGEVVHHKDISFKLVKDIIASIKEEGVVIAIESGYTTYVIHGEYTELNVCNELTRKELEDIKSERLSLISLYYPKSTTEEVDEICRTINEKYLGEIIAYRNSKFVDVVPIGCSKGEGVRYIMERESIPKEDVYAIGDSWNDISMFNVSGNSFTFSDVEDEIKKEVNNIVKSVAEAIEDYCL